MKYQIKRLDFNVAYACNLSCKGCISLSDFDRRGVESLDDIQSQCDTWSKVLDPMVISIFGGEPLLHPKIHKVLASIREAWPQSIIRFITNGYLLRRFDPETWFRIGNLEMQISIHRQDHEKIITGEIRRIVDQRKEWLAYRKIKDGHKQLELVNKDLTIYKSKFKRFVMPYRLVNGVPKPYKSDPSKAHKICGSPDVPILYKNRLYKCAPIANLIDIDQTGSYSYNGVEHNGDVISLIDRIGKPEIVCAMCPENMDNSIDHFAKENVNVKNID